KGAYGGDTDAPLGWGLISRWLEGHLWPNGDPDKLRKLSTAWDDAAKGLRDASELAGPAWAPVEDLASPDLTKALAQMDLVANDVENLASEYESLGRACSDWAEKIEDAHTQIRHIIRDTIGWAIVAGVVGGIVGSLVGPEGTVGGATLAASADAMEAAAQIRPILIALDAAAGLATGAVAAGVVGVGVAVAGVTQDLQPLLQANASIYNAEGGGMVSGQAGNFYPKPNNLPAFPNATRAKPKTSMPGGGKRFRWKDPKGTIYEWDYQHGEVEVYNKSGKHLGEFDPNTGAQTKPANPKRQVEP
ncbi:MAG TPA: colicin E3/pyocin S6 family cytotoxin, partial [Candidatus Saccharimonadales bacterium]|nr:colicin E3/pyocin S6 family cytotoxin [Candidatus Saccharimonadales bacterium]